MRQNQDFIRDVVAAWTVVLLLGAGGLALGSLRVPGGGDRVVLPLWHAPPVASATASDDEAPGAAPTDLAVSRRENGNGAEQLICDKVARSAHTPAHLVLSAARGSQIPC